MATKEFTYIQNTQQLKEAVKIWEEEKILGIDIECENNLHHYGTYISIIQLSTKKHNWIIDVLLIKDMSAFIAILEDETITKIFHDISFDFRIIKEEFGVVPKNFFDTEKAAVYLGKQQVGLGSLLEEYFSVAKQSKFQMADWTKRPLQKEMLSYAVGDTAYLIPLQKQLVSELKEANKLTWLLQTFKAQEKGKFINKKPVFSDVKGFFSLHDKEKAIVKNLFNLREKLAKKVDRPPHFIMNNKRLKSLAQQPPKSAKEWSRIKGVHPIVRAKARLFYQAVEDGKKKPLHVHKEKPKKFSESQKKYIGKLHEAREHISNEHEVPSHIILSKDEAKEAAITHSLEHLISWKKELVEQFLNRD